MCNKCRACPENPLEKLLFSKPEPKPKEEPKPEEYNECSDDCRCPRCHKMYNKIARDKAREQMSDDKIDEIIRLLEPGSSNTKSTKTPKKKARKARKLVAHNCHLTQHNFDEPSIDIVDNLSDELILDIVSKPPDECLAVMPAEVSGELYDDVSDEQNVVQSELVSDSWETPRKKARKSRKMVAHNCHLTQHTLDEPSVAFVDNPFYEAPLDIVSKPTDICPAAMPAEVSEELSDDVSDEQNVEQSELVPDSWEDLAVSDDGIEGTVPDTIVDILLNTVQSCTQDKEQVNQPEYINEADEDDSSDTSDSENDDKEPQPNETNEADEDSSSDTTSDSENDDKEPQPNENDERRQIKLAIEDRQSFIVWRKEECDDKIECLTSQIDEHESIIKTWNDRLNINNDDIKELEKKLKNLKAANLKMHTSIESERVDIHTLISDIEEVKKAAMTEDNTVASEIASLQQKLIDLDNEVTKEDLNESSEPVADSKNELIEFLTESILEKSAQLECPVCLEECGREGGNIFTCEEQHLVCHTCRPHLRECPECRLAYRVWDLPRRHRYAERAAVELSDLRIKRDRMVGSN